MRILHQRCRPVKAAGDEHALSAFRRLRCMKLLGPSPQYPHSKPLAMIRGRLFVGLLLLLAAFSAHAAEDLYQGRTAVADQSSAEQDRGMQAALQQVLGKLSGLSQFEAYPGVAEALPSARRIVLAFYYENRPRMLPDGSKTEDLLLVANFAPRAVDQLRNDLQLPRWKPERQALTIWPIVDDGLERRIMPIELEYAWQGLADLAIDRGMPLRWPEPDENGEYAADVQLLWGGYTDTLAEEPPDPASAVATTTGTTTSTTTETLVIAALHDGPEWNVRMNLEYEGIRWSERFRGIDLETVLQQGLNQAIDQVVATSSIAAADVGVWQVDITVTHLRNGDDYLRCLAYLQGLSVVEAVGVGRVTAGKAQFSLTLNAAPDYLQQFLVAGKTLAPSAVEGEYQLLP